jgi:hypothetical protein
MISVVGDAVLVEYEQPSIDYEDSLYWRDNDKRLFEK